MGWPSCSGGAALPCRVSCGHSGPSPPGWMAAPLHLLLSLCCDAELAEVAKVKIFVALTGKDQEQVRFTLSCHTVCQRFIHSC